MLRSITIDRAMIILDITGVAYLAVVSVVCLPFIGPVVTRYAALSVFGSERHVLYQRDTGSPDQPPPPKGQKVIGHRSMPLTVSGKGQNASAGNRTRG